MKFNEDKAFFFLFGASLLYIAYVLNKNLAKIEPGIKAGQSIGVRG